MVRLLSSFVFVYLPPHNKEYLADGLNDFPHHVGRVGASVSLSFFSIRSQPINFPCRCHVVRTLEFLVVVVVVVVVIGLHQSRC